MRERSQTIHADGQTWDSVIQSATLRHLSGQAAIPNPSTGQQQHPFMVTNEPVLISKDAHLRPPSPMRREQNTSPGLHGNEQMRFPSQAPLAVDGPAVAMSTPSLQSDPVFRGPASTTPAAKQPTVVGYIRPGGNILQQPLEEPRTMTPLAELIAAALTPVQPPDRSSSLRRKKKKQQQLADMMASSRASNATSPPTLHRIAPDLQSTINSPATHTVDLPSWDGKGSLPVPLRKSRRGGNVSSEDSAENTPDRPPLTLDTFKPPTTSAQAFHTPTLEKLKGEGEYFRASTPTGHDKSLPESTMVVSSSAFNDLLDVGSRTQSAALPLMSPTIALSARASAPSPDSAEPSRRSLQSARSGDDVRTHSSNSSYQDATREVWNLQSADMEDGEDFSGLFFAGRKTSSRSPTSPRRSTSTSEGRRPPSASAEPVPPMPSGSQVPGLFRQASRTRRNSDTVEQLFQFHMNNSASADSTLEGVSLEPETWKLGRVQRAVASIQSDALHEPHSASIRSVDDNSPSPTNFLPPADEGLSVPGSARRSRASAMTDDSGDRLGGLLATAWPTPPQS